jgi:uncharacterized membrane protein YfcA
VGAEEAKVLDTLAVLIVSVLSGMGVGGGGLGVLYFALARGMEQRAAQGMNLILFICASASALAVNGKKRRLDPVSLALTGAVGCVAAYFGTRTAFAVSDGIIRRLFGGFLICLGLKAVLMRDKG